MGSFVSTTRRARRAKKRSDMIDRQIKADSIGIKREAYILLLGLEDSGMKTIINQMKIVQGLSSTDLAEYRLVIYNNLLDSVQSVLRYMKSIGVECVNHANQARIEKILDYRLDTGNGSVSFDVDVAEAIQYVWNDPVIAPILDNHSSDFDLMDSAPYFCGEVMRIGSPGYLPNERDVLKARKKTVGITETRFYADKMTLHVFDVSGGGSHRKKWIHYFESITSIIFCAPLSDYDQTYGLQGGNQLLESLVLFESVVNSRWFPRASVVLFLTKIDVFKHKILKVPLERYFPGYTGGSDINKAAKYILWKFMQVNRARLSIYPHLADLNDATMSTLYMRLVLSAVKETILQNAHKDAGIL